MMSYSYQPVAVNHPPQRIESAPSYRSTHINKSLPSIAQLEDSIHPAQQVVYYSQIQQEHERSPIQQRPLHQIHQQHPQHSQHPQHPQHLQHPQHSQHPQNPPQHPQQHVSPQPQQQMLIRTSSPAPPPQYQTSYRNEQGQIMIPVNQIQQHQVTNEHMQQHPPHPQHHMIQPQPQYIQHQSPPHYQQAPQHQPHPHQQRPLHLQHHIQDAHIAHAPQHHQHPQHLQQLQHQIQKSQHPTQQGHHPVIVSNPLLSVNRINFPIYRVPQHVMLQITEEERKSIPSESDIGKRKYSTNIDERNFLTVFEYVVNNNWIIWDYYSGLVHLTGLWKAVGNAKADIVKLVDSSPELAFKVKRIRGGFLKIQGTWVPYDIARKLASKFCYSIRYALVPLFGEAFIDECLKPDERGFGQLRLNVEDEDEDGQKKKRRRRRKRKADVISGVPNMGQMSTEAVSQGVARPMMEHQPHNENDYQLRYQQVPVPTQQIEQDMKRRKQNGEIRSVPISPFSSESSTHPTPGYTGAPNSQLQSAFVPTTQKFTNVPRYANESHTQLPSIMNPVWKETQNLPPPLPLPSVVGERKDSLINGRETKEQTLSEPQNPTRISLPPLSPKIISNQSKGKRGMSIDSLITSSSSSGPGSTSTPVTSLSNSSSLLASSTTPTIKEESSAKGTGVFLPPISKQIPSSTYESVANPAERNSKSVVDSHYSLERKEEFRSAKRLPSLSSVSPDGIHSDAYCVTRPTAQFSQ